MVFKLTPVQVLEECGFENDVKEYGFQAVFCGFFTLRAFENDVKEYGFQAFLTSIRVCDTFENDVKEYGFQALLFQEL